MRKSWLQGLMIVLLVLPTLGTLGAVTCLPADAGCQTAVMCPMAQRSGHGNHACCRCQMRSAQPLAWTSLPPAVPPALTSVSLPAPAPARLQAIPAADHLAGFASLPYRPPRPLPALT